MRWPAGRLGDVVTLQRGHDLPSYTRQDGNVPVVSSSGITGYHNESKARAPGVVTGRYGTLGEVFYLDQDYWPLNTALYVTDFKGNVPKFVAYFLKHVLLSYQSDKAAVPGVDRNVLHEMEVRTPDRDAQQRITDVLSAYDDLIENNRRRMALLENAARLLYEEWFVRLRFPGHEHTQTINGVPEGWNLCALDDLCHIGRGASPRPIMKFMGGETPWFKIGDATASANCFIFQTREHVTEEGAKNSVLLYPGALILSNSATCGIPYFTGVRGCVHDGWLHFSQLKRISQQFLYCYLYFKREELVSSVGDGSTQKNLNTTAVGRLRLCLPCTDTLLTLFQQMTEPVFSMARNLAQQNMALRAARNLLLPRLMSGEIAV
jgi:type I restriction enzyme, S subunit